MVSGQKKKENRRIEDSFEWTFAVVHSGHKMDPKADLGKIQAVYFIDSAPLKGVGQN